MIYTTFAPVPYGWETVILPADVNQASEVSCERDILGSGLVKLVLHLRLGDRTWTDVYLLHDPGAALLSTENAVSDGKLTYVRIKDGSVQTAALIGGAKLWLSEPVPLELSIPRPGTVWLAMGSGG